MLTVLVLLWGCSKTPEGSNPGECDDGLDNDNDGLSDCFDPDCSASSECGGDTDPASTDEGLDEATCLDGVDNDEDGELDCADAGCDGLFACDVCADQASEEGASVVPVFASFSVTFVRTYDFNEFGDSLCALSPGVCDCVATYVGTGFSGESAGSTAHFLGTWALDAANTTCQDFATPSGQDNLAKQVWYDDSDPDVYMTLRFSRDGNRLDQWVVHNFETADFPVSEDEGIRDSAQFWMACMDVPFSATLPYQESVTVPLSDGVELTVTDAAEFSFQ
jgi:hypothetical protein